MGPLCAFALAPLTSRTLKADQQPLGCPTWQTRHPLSGPGRTLALHWLGRGCSVDTVSQMWAAASPGYNRSLQPPCTKEPLLVGTEGPGDCRFSADVTVHTNTSFCCRGILLPQEFLLVFGLSVLLNASSGFLKCPWCHVRH